MSVCVAVKGFGLDWLELEPNRGRKIVDPNNCGLFFFFFLGGTVSWVWCMVYRARYSDGVKVQAHDVLGYWMGTTCGLFGTVAHYSVLYTQYEYLGAEVGR